MKFQRRRKRQRKPSSAWQAVTGSSTIPALLRSGEGRANVAATVWDRAIVPMLQIAPGPRPIGVLEEIRRRRPEIDRGVRRTLERRIRHRRGLNGPERETIFREQPGAAATGRSRGLDRR
jgi:hypothetical protein